MQENDIKQQTSQLIHAILDSGYYYQYQEARTRLLTNPEKYERTQALRKKSFELQNCEHHDSSDEVQNLIAELELNRRDSDVDAYISAEQSLCKAIRDVIRDIVQGIDLDLEV